MQPNDQLPTPGGEPNPYEFILNTGATPPVKGGGKKIVGNQPPQKPSNNMKQRILVVVGGLIILVIAAMILISITSNAGKGGLQTLVDLGAEQTEIIRVSSLADTKARDSSTLNLATTSRITTTTDFKTINSLVVGKGTKLTGKEYGSKRNAKTDALLLVAEQNNRYDETFKEILVGLLTTYQTHLKAAYESSTIASEKQALAKIFENANIVLSSK